MKDSPFLKGYRQIWVPGSRGRKGYFRTQKGSVGPTQENRAQTQRAGTTGAANKKVGLPGARATGTRPEGVVSHTWGAAGATAGSVGIDRAVQLYGEVKRERGSSPVSDRDGVEMARRFLDLGDSWDQAKEMMMEELNSREQPGTRKSLFEGEDIDEFTLDEHDGLLEKAKRIWIPPSGNRKGYFRSDPRGKSRRQVNGEKVVAKEKPAADSEEWKDAEETGVEAGVQGLLEDEVVANEGEAKELYRGANIVVRSLRDKMKEQAGGDVEKYTSLVKKAARAGAQKIARSMGLYED